MEFIETTVFSRFLLEHLTDTEFSELQQKLVKNPKLGDKIPGSGGLKESQVGIFKTWYWQEGWTPNHLFSSCY